MSKKEWLAGMRAIYPVCFGYIPMGLACGVLLQQAGYHWLAVMLMSLIIYGGASQFMIASMTVAGAGLLEMVIMIFFINLRHLLMSSSLAHRIREKSTAFSIFFAQTITDESFAVNTLYFRINYAVRFFCRIEREKTKPMAFSVANMQNMGLLIPISMCGHKQDSVFFIRRHDKETYGYSIF